MSASARVLRTALAWSVRSGASKRNLSPSRSTGRDHGWIAPTLQDVSSRERLPEGWTSEHRARPGSFDDLVEGATSVELSGLTVPVLSLNQLIQSKAALDQPKDRELLDQLMAIRDLRDES